MAFNVRYVWMGGTETDGFPPLLLELARRKPSTSCCRLELTWRGAWAQVVCCAVVSWQGSLHGGTDLLGTDLQCSVLFQHLLCLNWYLLFCEWGWWSLTYKFSWSFYLLGVNSSLLVKVQWRCNLLVILCWAITNSMALPFIGVNDLQSIPLSSVTTCVTLVVPALLLPQASLLWWFT